MTWNQKGKKTREWPRRRWLYVVEKTRSKHLEKFNLRSKEVMGKYDGGKKKKIIYY